MPQAEADFLWDVFEMEHGLNGLNGYGTDFFGTLNPASGSLIWADLN